MSSKEKAMELFKAYQNIGMGEGWAKDCILITVNEVINANPTSIISEPFIGTKVYEDKGYWEAVKLEIKKL